MLSVLSESILPKNYEDNDIFDIAHHHVCRLSYKQEHIIIELINNQIMHHPKKYSIYKQQFDTNTFSLETDYYIKKTIFPITISLTENNLVLQIISKQDFIDIINNNKNRYIFLPINYESLNIKDGHRSMFVIDTYTLSTYMIDPNGKPSYINDIVKENVSHEVELLLSNYIKDTGLNLTYIFTEEWNKKNIYFNGQFNNNYIGDGHCVCLSYMIIHLMITNNINQIETYNLLNNLEKEEILYMIMTYTQYIYELTK